MSEATKLRCPKCADETTTLRRSPTHMPCFPCAMAGRGVVQRVVVMPEASTRIRSEPPAPREAPEPTTIYKWNCALNGHVFDGDACGYCHAPHPENPAAPTIVGAVVVAVLVLAALLAWSRPAHAQEWAPPSTGEVVALAAAESLIAVDALQTIAAVRAGGRELDAAALLGEHPSPARVALTCAAGGALLAAVWLWLPPRVRYIAPGVVVGVELFVVTDNATRGLAPWGAFSLSVRGAL